jgi:ABC-type glycerol-3-phosphate transport system substrate-binding protein
MSKVALALAFVVMACGGVGAGTTNRGGTRAGATGATGNSGASQSARPFRDLAAAFNANPYKVTSRVSSTAGSQAVSGMQT